MIYIFCISSEGSVECILMPESYPVQSNPFVWNPIFFLISICILLVVFAHSSICESHKISFNLVGRLFDMLPSFIHIFNE